VAETDLSKVGGNMATNNKSIQNKEKNRFRVGLSFPGEYRDEIIKPVADCLARQLTRPRVLYDRYYEAEFARTDLDVYLPNLYLNECDLVAVFLCKEYENKKWCGLEWRAVRALIKKKKDDQIMLFRLDDIDLTTVPGLLGIEGTVDVGKRSGEAIASLILERLEFNDSALSAQVDKTSESVLEQPTSDTHYESEPTDEEKRSQVEAICKLVLKQIASLLENEQLLKEELSERLEGAAEVVLALCEAAKTDPGAALDKLIAATRKTLEKMQSIRGPDLSITYTNASKVMNWLLLLSVDPGWLWRHRDILIDGVTAQPLVASAESEFGADLGFSALQQRLPSRRQMVGLFELHLPDTLNIDGLLDPGPGELAQLDEIKKALWKIVFPVPTKRRPEEASSYQPPKTFGRGKKSRHNDVLNEGIVSLRNSEDRDHYCITSTAIDQSDFSRGLIRSLQEDLPGLSVVVFGLEGGRSVLVVLEHAIQTRLRNMHGLMQAEDER
jgi:hypothetical protein